jgi:hypothetical protein
MRVSWTRPPQLAVLVATVTVAWTPAGAAATKARHCPLTVVDVNPGSFGVAVEGLTALGTSCRTAKRVAVNHVKQNKLPRGWRCESVSTGVSCRRGSARVRFHIESTS